MRLLNMNIVYGKKVDGWVRSKYENEKEKNRVRGLQLASWPTHPIGGFYAQNQCRP